MVTASGWQVAPRVIEDTYNVSDAVVVGTYLNSLLRHGDRVKVANQAQLVNVIAPIRSEEGGPAWRQTIFWPFARTAALAKGEILRLAVTSDQTPTAKYGDVDVVDVAGTYDADTGTVALFLANRGLEEQASVEIDLRGLSVTGVTSAEVLSVPEGADRLVANTLDAQDRVGLLPLKDVAATGSSVRLTLPALSWAAVELAVTTA